MDGREVIEKGLITIGDDKIIYLGKASGAPRIRAEKVINGRGKVALPGLTATRIFLWPSSGESGKTKPWTSG